MMQFIFIFCLLFNLTSAVKITHITLKADEVKAEPGSWLEIPCSFATDIGFKLHELTMEWGIIQSNSGLYTPIIILNNSNLMKLDESSKRAHIFALDFPYGNCTLVINPTNVNDSGIYEVRLSADGVLYVPAPKVKVIVVNSSDSQLEDHPKEREMQLKQKIGKKQGCKTLGPNINNNTAFDQMRNSWIMKIGFTFCLIIGGFLLVLTVVGVVFWCLHYRLLKKKLNNDIEMQREEQLEEVNEEEQEEEQPE